MCKEHDNDAKEEDEMNAIVERKGYKKLDLDKLNFSDKVVPIEEAIQDVIPIPWSQDVLSGKKKAIIKKKG